MTETTTSSSLSMAPALGCLLAVVTMAVPSLMAVETDPRPTGRAPTIFVAEDYAEAGISTSGTLIGALNATAEETVNTVEFSAVTQATAEAGPITLRGGVSVDIFGQRVGVNSNRGGGTRLTPDFIYGKGAGAGTIRFSGLTKGRHYLFQLVASERRFAGSSGTFCLRIPPSTSRASFSLTMSIRLRAGCRRTGPRGTPCSFLANGIISPSTGTASWLCPAGAFCVWRGCILGAKCDS